MHFNNHIQWKAKEGLNYLVFNKWHEDPRISHCFTTRQGGVSEEHLSSLNLGFNRGDKHDNVMKNYQIVCNALDVPLESVVLSKQVHETNIVKVESSDVGNGILYSSKWESADGMYTKVPEVTLVTHYADCVPLLFYAPGYSIIGMTHAGWRGTVNKIAKALIDIWVHTENIPIKAIQVGIGPSIGKCCFEVGSEVADEFLNEFGEQSFITYNDTSQKYHIDLWETNKHVLLSSGINEDNIFGAELCTSCNEDIFFSHRKSRGNRGTLGAFMVLRP